MRLFKLHRSEDVSGVSGTGIVAEGVVFGNGKCALSWCVGVSSTVIYDCIEDLIAIHGHDGRTKVIYDECISGVSIFTKS